MINLKVIEDQCVGCHDELGCIGDSCKYKNVECFYCDNCSDQTTLYEFEGRQLCIECIKKLLPLVEGSEIYDF